MKADSERSFFVLYELKLVK